MSPNLRTLCRFIPLAPLVIAVVAWHAWADENRTIHIGDDKPTPIASTVDWKAVALSEFAAGGSPSQCEVCVATDGCPQAHPTVALRFDRAGDNKPIQPQAPVWPHGSIFEDDGNPLGLCPGASCEPVPAPPADARMAALPPPVYSAPPVPVYGMGATPMLPMRVVSSSFGPCTPPAFTRCQVIQNAPAHCLRAAEEKLEEAASMLEAGGKYDRADAARDMARDLRAEARRIERPSTADCQPTVQPTGAYFSR